MFTTKKIIGLLIEPLTLGLLLILLGVLLLKWLPSASRMIITLALIGLYLCSTDLLSDALLLPLERKYPAWVARDTPEPVEFVVVLGGGHNTDPGIPITSQLKPFSLTRLTEGVRIWHHNPQSQLVLSGYAVDDAVTNAEMMKRLAVQLGVPESAILLQALPRDTAEEAKMIAPVIRNKRSVLVTSGYHMPRAMALFSAQGAQPEPAPTEHLAHVDDGSGWYRWVPSPHDLTKSSRAVHEYVGMAWARLNGQVF